MLSLAALTAAAQLDDDAPSGYVASYSEGEHTVQSELFYLPPSHSVEKRLREMASEVDRPTETDAIASARAATELRVASLRAECGRRSIIFFVGTVSSAAL